MHKKTATRSTRALGELETEVMRRLWRRATPTTVRELVDELQQDRGIAYTTVMTVLDNLHRKGWVSRDLDRRAYRYQPVSSGAEYTAELMRGALNSSPDHVAAFAHFLRELPPDQVRALEDAYRQLTGGALERDRQQRSGRSPQGRKTGR
jgi:predicted transcriptional regulator